MQIAKTYKVIGTLYIINNSPAEAREYLMRAHQVFESRGLLKLLKEVKNKLKMLSSSVKMTAEMAAQEANDSGDDSGKDPSQDRGEGVKAAKKKKGVAKKKVKRAVFRNNFVKESESQQ